MRNMTRRILLNLGMRLGVQGKFCGKRLTYLSSEDKLKIRVTLSGFIDRKIRRNRFIDEIAIVRGKI